MPKRQGRTEGTPTSFGQRLFAIGIGALVLRLAYLAALNDDPLFSLPIGDGWVYDAWAQRIAAGDWMGTEIFYQAPLYPYVLALVYTIIGHSLTAVRIVQALLGATACVLLGVAGRQFFDERSGLMAAVLLAIYPWVIFSDGLIQKSSLDLFLMTGSLASLARFEHERSSRWLVLAGAAIGAFSLTREPARLVYPIAIAWLLLHFRHTDTRKTRLAWIGVVTAAFAFVVVPVALRNYIVGGEFLISTAQMGPNFYIGNHRGASGAYEPLIPGGGSAERERDDAFRLAEEAVGRKLSPKEMSHFWLNRALAFVREEPWEWLKLSSRKLLLTLNAADVADSESLPIYAERSRLLWVLSWLNFGVLLPLAVFGAWQTRADWRRLMLLYAIFTAFLVSVVAFFVLARYRLPLLPIAVLFAAAGLSSVSSTAPLASLKAAPAGLALAGVVAAICHLPVAKGFADPTLFNVGMAFLKANRPQEAVSWLQKAVTRSPDDAAAYFAMGGAYTELGDLPRAIDALQAAVQLEPGDGEAQGALALALQSSGRLEGAVPHFLQAVRARPQDPVAHTNLGMAMAQLGDRPRAIAELHESLRLRPNHAPTLTALSVLLFGEGRAAEALTAARAAVRLQPRDVDLRMTLAEQLERGGQRDEAIDQAREAVRLAPRALQPRYFLIDSYAKAGRRKELVAALQDALSLAQASGSAPDVARLESVIRSLEVR